MEKIHQVLAELGDDVAYKLAEDAGISYENRRSFLKKNPGEIVGLVLNNMGKQDRNRAVFDLLIDRENADRAQAMIEINSSQMLWTKRMAIATFCMTIATVVLVIADVCKDFNLFPSH